MKIFDVQELMHTGISLRNTAPGQDNITNEMIQKNFSKTLLFSFYKFSFL